MSNACAHCRHAGARHLAASCTERLESGERCQCPGFQRAHFSPRRLGLALLLALAGGCAHLAPLPGLITGPGMPPWLYCARVDATGRCDVYRSGQPTKAQLVAMRDAPGIKLASVLKLNSALEGRDDAPAGVELVEHPISSVLGPARGEGDRICEDLDAMPKPALVHCTEGRERTGWAIERCLRMRQRPLAPSADAMFAEWLAYGMRSWLASGLIEDFDRATSYARQGAR